MASHPYISGARNITQMIGFLRKSFPATVTSDTVKKLGLAPQNESYVINVLQFLNVIDGEGKRTDVGHTVLTKHDDTEFQEAFGNLIKAAYTELFELRGDAAWEMSRDQLIGYFRSADKTGDVIGGRQANVFIALRDLAGHATDESTTPRMKAPSAPRKTAPPKRVPKAAASGKAEEVLQEPPVATVLKGQKGDVTLTVRIEINLPAEGTQETYDAIFKSIRANLFP
ncbi:DUF5343 domain-containing protein [Mesorhizobium sp. CA13]|uniref:DUF5343 domain-containing protein n=1 Tax=unclassified Mesorhizobium TaxID=325217 RepID=UPI0011274AED|nr:MULTISPECIES: DUF5343 domain-containing protein [unclassified Mesorhizobium]MBZ9854605.1 DUF5343 domain-containing protein [Mesorhizobium sp. CA13]TPN66575.1 hypothetical protein FJ986_14335 [Mesorhizobium sp. B1-1-1]